MPLHDAHIYRILDEIEGTSRVSQRALARRAGIALGLTNVLIRELVRRDLVRIQHVQANRVNYQITPAGLQEKDRVARLCLQRNLYAYSDVKSRIRERLGAVSAECEAEAALDSGQKPIVFYGAGEVAEVAYVCLKHCDLALVGVVEAGNSSSFFGVPVYDVKSLEATMLDGKPFLRIFVTALKGRGAVRRILRARGIHEGRICWL